MNLSFNQYGDLNTTGGGLTNSSQAEVQLSKFMFYAAVKRGSYKYDLSYGNTLNTILGKTKTIDNLKLLQKYLDKDLIQSDVFSDIDTNVEVYSIARTKVAIKITGTGINASWNMKTTAGLGINLLSFNDGTNITPLENEVATEVFVTIDGQLAYDITHTYTNAMTKNNISSFAESDFNIRALFKASNASEARIVRSDEYIISEGLQSRKIEFYRSLSGDGHLSIEIWPKDSVITSTSNPYLLRKHRTSAPTTLANTY